MLFCSKTSRPATRPTPPPSQWVPGLFSGGKATRAEADHSHPTNSTIQKQWTYTSSPCICLHVVDPGKFIFTDNLQRAVAELSVKNGNNPYFIRFSEFLNIWNQCCFQTSHLQVVATHECNVPECYPNLQIVLRKFVYLTVTTASY